MGEFKENHLLTQLPGTGEQLLVLGMRFRLLGVVVKVQEDAMSEPPVGLTLILSSGNGNQTGNMRLRLQNRFEEGCQGVIASFCLEPQENHLGDYVIVKSRWSLFHLMLLWVNSAYFPLCCLQWCPIDSEVR